VLGGLPGGVGGQEDRDGLLGVACLEPVAARVVGRQVVEVDLRRPGLRAPTGGGTEQGQYREDRHGDDQHLGAHGELLVR
jgi:hypothetical protein